MGRLPNGGRKPYPRVGSLTSDETPAILTPTEFSAGTVVWTQESGCRTTAPWIASVFVHGWPVVEVKVIADHVESGFPPGRNTC